MVPKEETATPFVFTRSVFCLRKPEAERKMTRAPVGRIVKYFCMGFTLYRVLCEVYVIGWVHFTLFIKIMNLHVLPSSHS